MNESFGIESISELELELEPFNASDTAPIPKTCVPNRLDQSIKINHSLSQFENIVA